MKTFGDLLSGGGGATIGAIAAGLTPVWAVEANNAIADCYERNLGKHVIRAKVQDVDYSKLPSVWLLHMSPVCTSFSVAKANGEETQIDIDIAHACARAIRENKPRNVTLENVRGYRKSKSFKIICDTLRDCGYKYRVVILDSANFGVPQNRIRLFILASLDQMPRKPQPTHQKPKDEQQGLFEMRLPNWVGWYEAIEDLIPTLPESRFANWQLARLPAEMSTMLVSKQEQCQLLRDINPRTVGEPSATITALDYHRPSSIPKAFIIGGANTSEAQAASGVGVSEQDEPTRCVSASNSSNWRAFIVEGSAAGIDNKFTMPVRSKNEPVFTLRGRQNNPRACLGGRVVSMTPRALARFMSIPDWYELSGKAQLDCRLIGNAVAPLAYREILRCFE